MALIYLSGPGLVCISEVDAGRGDLEQLLSVPGDGVGQVDDVHDFWAAELGDLHSSHGGRLWPGRRGHRVAVVHIAGTRGHRERSDARRRPDAAWATSSRWTSSVDGQR